MMRSATRRAVLLVSPLTHARRKLALRLRALLTTTLLHARPHHTMAAAPSPTPPSSSSPTGSSTPASASTATATTSTAQSSDSSDAADRKRAHRAQKKAEQQARKDERRKFADEHGVDPADLPPSVASALKKGAGPGDAKPKGFVPRKWVEVPAREEDGEGDEASKGKQVAILSWNVRRLFLGVHAVAGRRPSLGAARLALKEAH